MPEVRNASHGHDVRTARWLLVLYTIFTLAVAVSRDVPLLLLLPTVGLLLLVSALLGGRVLGHEATWHRAPAWALLPLLAIPVLYAQVAALDAGESMRDAVLLVVERRWFGEPAREWATRYPNTLLSAMLHACYLAYYAIIYLPPLRLARRGERAALDETMLALTITFTLGLVCFVLWPVEGPRYHWPRAADAPTDPARAMATALLERFSSRGTAFPSSHVSIAVVQTAMAWRWQRPVAWLLTPLTVGLAIGAVYGGFHYLIDVVVGAALGGLVAAGFAWRRWRLRRTAVPSIARALSMVLLCLAATGCATAAGGHHRFYDARPYGSESQFNPLSQLVNEGFDLLRGDDADRRILELPYAVTARNLRSSVLNAGNTIGQYGWQRWLRNEILPLTLKGGGGGQWVPNYQFHLIGSGMVSARMTEWFEQHDVPHPVLWSAVTMTASHVLNEMTERPTPRSVDAITDLLLFDTGGFLLFRSDRVQRMVSGRVQLTNWPLQPSFTLPGRTLENMGQEFVLRVPLPRTTRWRGLYMFGVSTLLGVSRDLGDGHALSVGLGADAVETPVVDAATDTRTVRLKPNAGVFLDRHGSLLASLLVRNGYETVASLNVYPGAVAGRSLPVGLWLSTLQRGGVRVGVTSRLGLGIARGPVRPP